MEGKLQVGKRYRISLAPHLGWSLPGVVIKRDDGLYFDRSEHGKGQPQDYVKLPDGGFEAEEVKSG